MEHNSLNKWPIGILIVEDEETDICALHRAFTKLGDRYRLYIVNDGDEAIAFLHRAHPFTDAPRPDVILLDLNMPGVDGKEVLKYVKTAPELRDIPVIVHTSSTAASDIDDCCRLHANAYVPKASSYEGTKEMVFQLDSLWTSVVKLPQSELPLAA